jgi:hypothetical protein
VARGRDRRGRRGGDGRGLPRLRCPGSFGEPATREPRIHYNTWNFQERNKWWSWYAKTGDWTASRTRFPEGLGPLKKKLDEYGMTLGLYRQVRVDMAQADPVVTGPVGGSPEIHEKVASNGRGAIVVFSTATGTRRYVSTQRMSRDVFARPGARVSLDADGRAVVETTFDKPGAAIVFFGARQPEDQR